MRLPEFAIIPRRPLAGHMIPGSSLSRLDYCFMAIAAACVFLRLLNAGADFSYDYAAYIFYFEVIGDYSVLELLGSSFSTFPYVPFANAPVFEVGFVLISKWFLIVCGTPALTYASIATLSVTLRSIVLRKFGCPWRWIVVVQIYALTLFEANAIRVGCASTIVLWGLYFLWTSRPHICWVLFAASAVVHLQVIIFLAPFVLLWRMRASYASRPLSRLLISCLLGGVVILIVNFGAFGGYAKLSEYSAKASNSSGIGITSLMAAVFVLYAICSKRDQSTGIDLSRLLWLAVVVAIVPSLALFMFATQIAALGDRAWQFAFVVVSAIAYLKWGTSRHRFLGRGILWCVALVSVINVTVRYPLSCFFDFIYPYTLQNL